MSSFRFVLVGAALVGLCISILWHVDVLLGGTTFDSAWPGLLLSMIPVWIAAVLRLRSFRSVIRSVGDLRGLFFAISGAPGWMKWISLLTLPNAAVSWYYGRVRALEAGGYSHAAFSRFTSSFLVMMYALSATVLYAALRREGHRVVWRCANGHELERPAAWCARCGEKVQPVFTQRSDKPESSA